MVARTRSAAQHQQAAAHAVDADDGVVQHLLSREAQVVDRAREAELVQQRVQQLPLPVPFHAAEQKADGGDEPYEYGRNEYS